VWLKESDKQVFCHAQILILEIVFVKNSHFYVTEDLLGFVIATLLDVATVGYFPMLVKTLYANTADF